MSKMICSEKDLKVGVLALQGAFREHCEKLEQLGVVAVEVRLPEHLDSGSLAGLILPGGESTAIVKLVERWGLMDPLRAWVHDGHPIWGTCAGMILLADEVLGQKEGGQSLIGGLDATVHRNYFGSQLGSFQAPVPVPSALGNASYNGVFIRAPAVIRCGEGCEILARVRVDSPGSSEAVAIDDSSVVVAVRQAHILATAFHPELTEDSRWHAYFLNQIVRRIP